MNLLHVTTLIKKISMIRRTLLQTGRALGIAVFGSWFFLSCAVDSSLQDYPLHAVHLRDIILPNLLNSEIGLEIDGQLLEASANFLAKESDPELFSKLRVSFNSINKSMHTIINNEWPNIDDGPNGRAESVQVKNGFTVLRRRWNDKDVITLSFPPDVQLVNEFRVNVYRLQTAGEGRKRHFLAWQPTGEWNPHKPMKFGTLKLVSQP